MELENLKMRNKNHDINEDSFLWIMYSMYLKPIQKKTVCIQKSVQKVSSHVIFSYHIKVTFIEDTRYKNHWTQGNVASVPFKVGTLEPHTVLPITISCPVVFSWISLMVWNLFLFKGDFSLGKSRKSLDARSGL